MLIKQMTLLWLVSYIIHWLFGILISQLLVLICMVHGKHGIHVLGTIVGKVISDVIRLPRVCLASAGCVGRPFYGHVLLSQRLTGPRM